MKTPVVVDFETEAIAPRPGYPPKPVGVALWEPGRKPRYLAWGHPTGNNATVAQAKATLRQVWHAGELLFHNAKFDLDVAETHLGLAMPPWERVHDTLYSLFLDDPHAISLSLKPAAERLLKLPPEEQDAVNDWLVEHGVIKRANQKDAGAYICHAPGELVGAYAIGDVVRTRKLHELLFPKIVAAGMGPAYDIERELMPILLNNEREGMRVDVNGLERDIKLYQAALVKADAWLRKRLHAPALNLDADAGVAAVFKRENMITEWAKTPTGRDSVAKKNLTPEKFADAKVAQVFGYRNRLAVVLSMSMVPWLEQATRCKGLISTEWNQVRQAHGNDGKKGTRTGRLSCSRFQNITKDFTDKDDGYVHPKFLGVPTLPLVRKYILPDEGAVFLHRDLGQQELRVLAHFEDGALCREYNTNPDLDVHTYVQELIEKLVGLKLHRRLVKIINFAKVYGMGVSGLTEKLKCNEEQAREFVRAHKAALPDVQRLDQDIKWRARLGKPIRTWGGRLYYCEAPKPVHGFMRTFEYKLLNYLIQGSSADWTKRAIIRYAGMQKNGRFLVTVHDEINVSVPKKYLKSENDILRKAMEDMPLDVPMRSSAKAGPNWGALKKLED